ncbi:MAG: monovalent cation/H+ antiporter complex subunit F [Defluviitaleaceae bacterium]|nr:monovalent cation/H+ antiporter complex subunit F [Defluviitaleaceae bacterium]
MYALWVLLIFLFVYIIRVVRGPSIWDRVLGMSLISTKIILIIAVFASVSDSSNLLDFAIIYALSGFIGTIFVALFLYDRLMADKKKKEEDGE